MAETKTTIPVEIKMGNAGTNDANLPAFKEGSIIFTKDTKKIYIDPVGETERIAVGGEVDLSGKQDTITDSTNLTVNNLIVSSVLSLGKNDSENPISIQGLVTNSKPIISISSASGEYPRISGVGTPTADNDAVNRGYLTTKYGSTYYDSTVKEFYLPGGTNLVIPNTQMGRLYIGSESSTSTDFKIYVNDPLDDGKLIITNLKIPTNDEDAANKAYVDTKQDKFATVTTANTVQTVKIGDTLSIATTPNLNVDMIKSTGVLELSGNDNAANSYVSLRKTKLGSSCDFDATQGYLRVRNDPLADDFAVNKKYVDDIKTELLNAITHPYTYDEDTKELTLIL